MSGFRFRLARVAHVRLLQERVARERWLEADRRANDAEAAAQDRLTELAAARDGLRAEYTAPKLALTRVLSGARQVDGLREKRRSAVEIARTLRFQADGLRRPWTERRQEVRGLERLEDRERERHDDVETAREARDQDERTAARAHAQARADERAKGGHVESETKTDGDLDAALDGDHDTSHAFQ